MSFPSTSAKNPAPSGSGGASGAKGAASGWTSRLYMTPPSRSQAKGKKTAAKKMPDLPWLAKKAAAETVTKESESKDAQEMKKIKAMLKTYLPPSSMKEEYDPLRPNDYEQLKKAQKKEREAKEAASSDSEDSSDDDAIYAQLTHLQPKSLPPAPPALAAAAPESSTVILLTNMVGPDEVDDALQSETAEECAKFGYVERCLIFVVPNNQVPENQAVRIFVQYDTQASATVALQNLDGRMFGGRRVKAQFFPSARFNHYDLAPSDRELGLG